MLPSFPFWLSRKSLIVFSKLEKPKTLNESDNKLLTIPKTIPTVHFIKTCISLTILNYLSLSTLHFKKNKKTLFCECKTNHKIQPTLYGYISAPSFTSQHYLKYFKSFIHNIKNKATQDNNGNVNVETEIDILNGNGKFCCQLESTGKIRITENPLPDSIC